jgi:shikimate kinase
LSVLLLGRYADATIASAVQNLKGASMKEEFDLVVEVTITYLKTIHANNQEEAQEIAENEAIEMQEIQEEYELDDYGYEVTTKKHKNPLLPSIRLAKRR